MVRKVVKIPIKFLCELVGTLSAAANVRDQREAERKRINPKHKLFNPYRDRAVKLQAFLDNPQPIDPRPPLGPHEEGE